MDYLKFVVDYTGIDEDTKLSTLTPADWTKLYQAIKVREGFTSSKPGLIGRVSCPQLNPFPFYTPPLFNVPPPDKDDKTTPMKDPIVLDLTGGGIQLTPLGAPGQGQTYFDYNGNGFAVQTGWIRPNNGFLVRVNTADGSVDNGMQLFSDDTVMSNGQRAMNGYQALADLDTNHDVALLRSRRLEKWRTL